MIKTIKNIFAVVLCMLFIPFAMASQDGSLAQQSSGQLDVTLKIPTLVKVSGLKSINFASTIDNDLNLKGASNFCVYTNNASNGYSLDVTGKYSPDGTFHLTSATDDDTIGYDVYFHDAKMQPGDATDAGIKLVSNNKVNGTNGKNDISTINCGDADSAGNANLEIRIPQANLVGKEVGEYTDILTLTVSAM